MMAFGLVMVLVGVLLASLTHKWSKFDGELGYVLWAVYRLGEWVVLAGLLISFIGVLIWMEMGVMP